MKVSHSLGFWTAIVAQQSVSPFHWTVEVLPAKIESTSVKIATQYFAHLLSVLVRGFWIAKTAELLLAVPPAVRQRENLLTCN